MVIIFISETPVLLDNTTHASIGLIRFEVNSIWGAVCPRYWDDSAANVTCNMLNYNGGIAYFGYTPRIWPGIFEGLNCLGNETDIAACTISSVTCDERIYHYEYPGAICYDAKSE